MQTMQRSIVQGCDMARTPEDDLPVAREYQRLLKSEVKRLGRDKIAKAAEVDPSTVHRNVNEKNLTYTTAMKLRAAIAEANRDSPRGGVAIPPPFVAVVSQAHFDACEILAKLHSMDYEAFGGVMEDLVKKYQEAVLSNATQKLMHPIRNQSGSDDDLDDD